QGLAGGQDRARSERQVEADHVPVELAKLGVQAHAAIQAHFLAWQEGKPRRAAKSAAVARTATKTHPARKSLSDFITERFDDFSRSQKDVARYIVDHL